MAGAVTRESLGSWLIKRNPADGEEVRFPDRGRGPSGWCVADNYRSRLMAPGDRMVLWVSGSAARTPRGVWGLGHVVGPARPTGPPDATGSNAEPDKVIRRIRLEVLVCIRPAGTPLATDAELRAAGIDDLEVQRMPFGSNPSWITRPQLGRMINVLGAWPARPSTID